MKFVCEYRTKDNVLHTVEVVASCREDVFSECKKKGIKPSRVTVAPGFWNKISSRFGRGFVIVILSIVAFVSVLYSVLVQMQVDDIVSEIESSTRRQLIGDAEVIAEGVATGWAKFVELEGERFLASFAVPGVQACVRNTTEEEIKRALLNRLDISRGDSMECRQIKSIVEGMKNELREYIKDGGNIKEYCGELVKRQEYEIRCYQLAKSEILKGIDANLPQHTIEAMLKRNNARLHRMGIRMIVLDD